MAGKLKDDEIRWILSLDAKGVQAELQKISSSTNRLIADNKFLKEEMKAIEKQIKATEKEMIRLEKVGATSSIKYKELQGTLASAKRSLSEPFRWLLNRG
jgi:septal ring factor EnvC (AmiA/AmiB activator)